MPWPTPQEYNEAIQNPTLCFADADLRSSVPDLTSLGLPRPITGNFASVYRMRGSQHWAVRCFFREYADSGERYAAISAHLAAARMPYTVGFEYLERGIRVGPSWFPVLKMQWVDGMLLGDFVASHRGDAAALRALGDGWLDMLQQLEQRSIAHGDLQHGNVLVVDGSLRLVDYDGMFVPALRGRSSHEIGHPNYQHPLRTGAHFSPGLDRFSGWVVYLSLLALERSPSLWEDLQAGDECLLFRRSDFETPEQSPVLSRLRAQPALRPIAEQAERILALPPARVPPVQPLGQRRPWTSGLTTSPSPLPAWLEGAVPRPPARQFARPALLPRLLAVMTACAALAAGVGASLSPLAEGSLLAAAECAALWLVYVTDPSVLMRTSLAGKLQARRVQLALYSLHVWAVDRGAHLRERRGVDEMGRLARKRAAIRQEHERVRDSLAELVQERVTRLDAALTQLTLDKSAAEENIRKARADRAVKRKLGKASIFTARIEGLGLAPRATLWLSGVRKARDVSSEHVDALGRLDPGDAAAVLRWRVDLERQARQSESPEIPVHIRRLLDVEYGRRETALRAQRRAHEHRRQALADRAALVHDLDMRKIDRRVALMAQRQQQAQMTSDGRLVALADRQAQLERDREDLQDRTETMRHLTFRRYLSAVVGLENAGTP